MGTWAFRLSSFDEEFRYRGHVSDTRLKTDGIVPSGESQSAPIVAAEFIALDIACGRRQASNARPNLLSWEYGEAQTEIEGPPHLPGPVASGC